jgi:hypothetical protein
MPMEPSSFTIEFPERLPSEKRQYCLDHLADAGASVESQGEQTFRIVCSKRAQLAMVGWALFHTHFSRLCRVVASSGSAEVRADAYQRPPKP